MRLIDADALYNFFLEMHKSGNTCDPQDVLKAITNAPTVQREGWVSVEDRLPDVKSGCATEFIVSVRRKHDNKSYTFSAYYLNEMDLYDDGNGDEVYFSGWHHQFKHDNYDEFYEPLHFNEGDVLTHWKPLPAAPDKE